MPRAGVGWACRGPVKGVRAVEQFPRAADEISGQSMMLTRLKRNGNNTWSVSHAIVYRASETKEPVDRNSKIEDTYASKYLSEVSNISLESIAPADDHYINISSF